MGATTTYSDDKSNDRHQDARPVASPPCRPPRATRCGRWGDTPTASTSPASRWWCASRSSRWR
eukprot:5489860-Pyramimonas_sp.AAC.1